MSGNKIHKTLLATSVVGALLLGGCSPIVNIHGYLPVAADVNEISVGTDTKDSVLSLLGEPTTKGLQGDNAWYYVSYTVSQFAFFAPKVTDRQILAVTFNGSDRVVAVER